MYLRNLQKQVKKAFCSSDLKNFASTQPSASNFESFSESLEHFFLTVGQNNFGNKIPNHWKEDVKCFLILLSIGYSPITISKIPIILHYFLLFLGWSRPDQKSSRNPYLQFCWKLSLLILLHLLKVIRIWFWIQHHFWNK